MLNEEQVFRYDLAWSCIYSIKFQVMLFNTQCFQYIVKTCMSNISKEPKIYVPNATLRLCT